MPLRTGLDSPWEKASGPWLAGMCPVLSAVAARLWVSRDLGKGRRNGEGSWIGTREENGNPELVPGISLIVSIPLVDIWSCIPQSFLAAQVQLSIVSEFPREGFVNPREGFVNPREPDLRPL